MCCESICIVTVQSSGWGATELGGGGVCCAPGSSTPGGNGLDRDATNAPTPAHAANTAIQITTLTGFGTRRGYRGVGARPPNPSGVGQPTPSPVMSARSDSPKQMNDAAENSTKGSVHRPPDVLPWVTSRAITWAMPRMTSGPNP